MAAGATSQTPGYRASTGLKVTVTDERSVPIANVPVEYQTSYDGAVWKTLRTLTSGPDGTVSTASRFSTRTFVRFVYEGDGAVFAGTDGVPFEDQAEGVPDEASRV